MNLLYSLWAWLKTEPARVTQGVQGVLGLLVALNVVVLTQDQTGAILSFTAGGFGHVLALQVRPFKWAAVTAVVLGTVVLVTGFGLSLTPEQMGAVYRYKARRDGKE